MATTKSTTTTTTKAPAGSLTIKSGGQTWVATPNASTTQAQKDTAMKAGWTPYSGSVPTTGKTVQGGQPLPPVDTSIKADEITTQKQPQIPPVTQTKAPELTMVNVPEPTTQDTSVESINNVVSKKINSILGNAPEMPSAVDTQRQIEKDLQIRQKEQAVQNYATQINQINDTAQKQILGLMGQGRGIPETIIGGQQEQIKREAAMSTLSLHSLLSAAQGDLDSTRAYADTLFNMYYKDATAKYDQWWKTAEIYRDEFNTEEQRRLDIMKEARNRENDFIQSKLDFNKTLALKAAEQGKFGLAQQIMNKKPPEVGDTQGWEDYDKDISRLTGGLVTATAGVATSPYQEERALRTIQSVDQLYNNALKSPGIFGRTAALPLPDFARTDAFRNFRTDLDTLKANIAFNELTAMREASKTGGALGAISERELGLLESSLGGLNMSQSPENFRKNLLQVKESINRWQRAVNQYSGSSNITVGPDNQEYEIID